MQHSGGRTYSFPLPDTTTQQSGAAVHRYAQTQVLPVKGPECSNRMGLAFHSTLLTGKVPRGDMVLQQLFGLRTSQMQPQNIHILFGSGGHTV